MGFLVRSMFWLAVVAAFMPRETAQDGASPIDVAAAERPLIDAAKAAAMLCGEQPEVCAAGLEAASVAGDIGMLAARSARDALAAAGEDS